MQWTPALVVSLVLLVSAGAVSTVIGDAAPIYVAAGIVAGWLGLMKPRREAPAATDNDAASGPQEGGTP